MKRSANIAAMLGLLTALLLGSTATASAGSATGRHSCSNGFNNVVTCNSVINKVVVKITGKRMLKTGEISVLENNLNNASVDVTILKNVAVDTYKSFNPAIDITVSDVNVCIASVCK